MPITGLVGVADVEARMGRVLADSEAVRAQALLEDATNLLQTDPELSVDADYDSGSLQLETVVRVVASMVKRALSAPDGVKTEQTGPFAVTFDNPNGDLFLRDSERVALGRRVSARTVRMGY